MASRRAPNRTLDLFSDGHAALRRHPEQAWPPANRFPLNLDGQKVRDTVVPDLLASVDPLIVTGFAGLDELIDAASGFVHEDGTLRILLGQEPFPSRRGEYRLQRDAFSQEVQEYWLERGISLLLSAKLVAFMEGLRSGRIRARYVADGGERLHAKIYCGDDAVTVGSSNFTRAGLDRQLEANVRLTRMPREAKRYAELRQVGENYWAIGRDYRDALLELLGQLLRVVSWQEALARACAELLEGDWARAYLDQDLPGASDLWPSQRQGIAQALYILARQGSVLIADATGSGKTRMGAHLLRALADQLLRSGRLRHGKSVMVTPPIVSEAWKDEAQQAGAVLDVYSHGTLSQERSTGHDRLVDALRRSQMLCVDEGHNFLNMKSQRSQHLLRNMADHVLVFTATPINRSVVDLLRIADLLGADNLDESTLETFQRMLGAVRLDRGLTEEERQILRGEIRRFTVRRTKRMLNRLIDREPDAYRDAADNRCRFPKHLPEVYPLEEPQRDRELAREIDAIASQLRGVTHFQKPLELPGILRRQGWSEATYLRSRLSSASKLARYMVRASLRSSRAALVEHIEGTQRAKELVKLSRYARKQGSGNMLGRLREIAGKVPANELGIELPEWLADPDAHREACNRERALYARVYKCVAGMSDHREQAKARKLMELTDEHDLVLAFDSRPITLSVVQKHLADLGCGARTIVATGDAATGRSKLLSAFAPGSGEKGVIGLCSDSLSEGVNLQEASCMVHLDMPSVVRIAEQRVGRVDRMDSPHRRIEAWWPEDGEEFALSTDDRFIERFETVENLLGSNLPLPEGMQGDSRAVRARDLIAEFEREAELQEWDGIDDAFRPVRDLVSGERALVEERTYERYREITARVVSRVSLVRARSPWAFFCLAAGAGGAPRWVLIPSSMGAAVLELDAVSRGLRERLGGDVESLDVTPEAEHLLERFLGRLSGAERLLLSRRKQRALEELEKVLGRFIQDAMNAGERELAERLHVLLQALQATQPDRQPDWDEIAARWLELIRPIWYERLSGPRKKPLLLKDIRRDLLGNRAHLAPALVERFARFPVLPPPDERVRACIVGVA